MMVLRNLSIGFVIGLLACAVGRFEPSSAQSLPWAMAGTSVLSAPPRTAPLQPAATSGRYQMCTWVESKAHGDHSGDSIPSSHGVYILDAQTGRVWFTQRDDPFVEIRHAE